MRATLRFDGPNGDEVMLLASQVEWNRDTGFERFDDTFLRVRPEHYSLETTVYLCSETDLENFRSLTDNIGQRPIQTQISVDGLFTIENCYLTSVSLDLLDDLRQTFVSSTTWSAYGFNLQSKIVDQQIEDEVDWMKEGF